MKQSLFADGEWLGDREVSAYRLADPNSKAYGTVLPYYNVAYFCPHCGEIWGRILYETARPEWQINIRQCARHATLGIQAVYAGSLISSHPSAKEPGAWADDWPEAATRREFSILLQKLEENIIEIQEPK